MSAVEVMRLPLAVDLGGFVSLLLSFVLAALTLPLTAQGALAADNDAELGIEAYVTGHQGEVPTVTPGQSFSGDPFRNSSRRTLSFSCPACRTIRSRSPTEFAVMCCATPWQTVSQTMSGDRATG